MSKRSKRVVIYGGTELAPSEARMAGRLTLALLRNESIFIATGGFRGGSEDRSGLVSTDVSVRDSAREYADATGEPLDTCLETWLPDPAKDRTDVDPHRFRDGRIQLLPGFSAQARRLKLVQSADAIVTVRGRVQTMMLLESAMVNGRPAIPLPFTGGDSAAHWADNRAHYVARLGLTPDQARLWETFNVDNSSDGAIASLAEDVVSVVSRVIGRKCLVLMPFAESFTELSQIIDGEGFHPIRLDRDLYTGDVRQTLQQLLEESDAIVADISRLSPNVMYEVGVAHAYNKRPLLIWRGDPARLEDSLPFYLRPQRIASVNESGDIGKIVKEYLQAIRVGVSIPRT